jgi:hypothetical protein
MPVKLKVITVIQILVNSILVILTDVNGAILDFTKWSRACSPTQHSKTCGTPITDKIIQSRTDNTMTKRKSTKGQTTIY